MASGNKTKTQSVGYYKYENEILGKGSFATVYLARHKIIRCEVALKVINTDEIEEEYVVRNLEREAHILKDLHHPNIIRLYETVKTVNSYCLSLELIRGVNLFQFLMKQNNRKISERLARVFFYQMLSAVGYMHRLHIIHRDLKLENILVEFGHIIKIVDFGLSNTYYPCIRLRTHCGSVEYAAPELFKSDYSLAADLWSLGVILYVMVVGQMPFPFDREEFGDSATKREEFLERITQGLKQENWELMENLSPECWNLLHDLLEPDQLRRIPIEGAANHPWITKDLQLKKKLPQSRKDLQRKLRPEIIDYLADLLNSSRMKIERRINAGHYNNAVACMFYIIRDTLVKEVLYSPKHFHTSFLYRFDAWKNKKTPYTDQNSNDHEKVTVFSEKHAKGLFSSIKAFVQPSSFYTNSFKTALNTGNQTNSVDDSKSRSQGVSVKQDFVRRESINHDFDSSKNIDVVENGTEQGNRSGPYRSYKSSRPENLKACSAGNKQNVKNATHDSKRNSYTVVTHRMNEKCSLSHPQKLTSIKTKCEEKESSKFDHEYPSTPSSNKSTKNNSGTFTKLKTSIIKETPGAYNDRSQLTIAKKPSPSSGGVTDSRTIDIRKKKTELTNNFMRNLSAASELANKKMNDDIISLQERTEKPPDCNEAQRKKRINPKTPSRIPVKNMHYGPPATFSQPFKSAKSKKTTVADRISCGGDTNEKRDTEFF